MTVEELEVLFYHYQQEMLFRQCRLHLVSGDICGDWETEDVAFVLKQSISSYEEFLKRLDKRRTERFFSTLKSRFYETDDK